MSNTLSPLDWDWYIQLLPDSITWVFSSFIFVQRILWDSSMIISAHLLLIILFRRMLNIVYEITTTFGQKSKYSRLSRRPNTEKKEREKYRYNYNSQIWYSLYKINTEKLKAKAIEQCPKLKIQVYEGQGIGLMIFTNINLYISSTYLNS